MREERLEVLVVGAGPVGLLTTLLLARAGVEVGLIDRESRTTSRSYACALHPGTLRLLGQLDLAAPLIELGHKVPTLAFYDQDTRQGELDLAQIDPEYPFLLILPQNALEDLLEQRLRQAGVMVNWNHRFDGFQDQTEAVAVTVEELEGTATGYIVPHWETTVKRQISIHSQFLIGADGSRSLVRQRAGLDSQRLGEPQFFAAYEFNAETAMPTEARVVLNDTTTNVLWPLGANRYRWTFQLIKPPGPAEFPQKERRSVRILNPAVDDSLCQQVQSLAARRAPWFQAGVKEVTWCTEVFFEQRLVSQFGRNRCWLAGDAAHQTGPVGIQSMNLGFFEAHGLAGTLRQILRQAAPLDLLAGYERQFKAQWSTLLGVSGGLKARSQASPWIGRHAARLLPCLPSTGADLARLANQLQLDLTL